MMLLYLLMAGLLPLALAQLSCPDGPNCSAPLCPNAIVQYMCNISVPRLFTRWTVPVQSCGGTDTTFLLLRQNAQSNCGSQSILCGLFQASNVPPAGDTPCTSSILHVNVTAELNGSLITCSSSDLSTQYLVGNAKLHVLSAPSTPHLSVTAKLNALEANCSFGDQDTYCDIIILMNGAVKSTAAANATFNRLTSNMMYQISARAINRCGDFSETSVSHWTLPEAPPTSTIRVHESLINGSATQLNIYWSHIGGNVSQYVVKSIFGMNTFTSQVSVQSFCVALSCAYNQTVKTTGSGYTITISSVNDGGVGPESDPVQGESQSSSSISYSDMYPVAVGVGVGVGVGIPLLVTVICIAAAFMKMHSIVPKHRSPNVHKGSMLESKDSSAKQPVSQKKEKVTECGNDTQFSPSEDKAAKQNQSPPKECETVQNHQYGIIQNTRKPFKRMPHYITNPRGRTVLSIQDDRLVFKKMNYIFTDTQLWYLDEQPDNSFMIVSKMNKMVLASTDNGVDIQIRRGDYCQRWFQDSNIIVSAKDRTVMCIKDQENVPVCLKKPPECGIICLQSSPMVPMCLADVEDGSVLEIKDDEVIVNPNMDFTNLSQHWYIYPGKKDRAFTIVSRKEQKVLQWDDNAELIVKNCDIDEEDAQWIILNGCFVVKKKWYMKDKRFNAHPMIQNCFMIGFQSYYLTWDLLTEKVVLSNTVNKSMPFDRHLWMLDMQLDGAFTMASCANDKKFLSNKGNTLVCCNLTSDDCHLWRQEGNVIKSESTHGHLIICSPATDEFVVIDNPEPLIDDFSRPEHEYATVEGHPTLAVSCRGTGDKQQLMHECATIKVLIQVSYIVHKESNCVLSSKNNNSEVTMCPYNCALCSTHYWVLDYQLDGTFFIISYTKDKLTLSCDCTTSTPAEGNHKLITSPLKGDESQRWGWDGDHIESVKFKGQVISPMPGNQTLCLSTKSATDKAQLFRQESYTPVLIRCLMDDTVLELDDASVLKFSDVGESWPDSQVWYLKYTNGFSNPSFMIISKKNGQALQGDGLNVEIKDRDTANEYQQWRRDELFIVSQRKNTRRIKVMSNTGRKLVLESRDSDKSRYFEFQHFAVESY